MFPIMDGGPAVPWRLVAPFEAMAIANHDQDLKTLARRGGLSAGELWCIVHRKRLCDMPFDADARRWLRAWIDEDVERVTAERIAAWLEEQPRYDIPNSAADWAEDIRAGKWKR